MCCQDWEALIGENDGGQQGSLWAPREHLAVATVTWGNRHPAHRWGQDTRLPPFGKIIWQLFQVQIHILFNPTIFLLGYKVTRVLPAGSLVGAKQH